MSAWLQQAAEWTWQNSLAAGALALAVLGLRRILQGRLAPFWLYLSGALVLSRLWLPAPLPHAWAWDRAWSTAVPPAPGSGTVPAVAPILVTAEPVEAGTLPALLELERELAEARVSVELLKSTKAAAPAGPVPDAVSGRESTAPGEPGLLAEMLEKVRSFDWPATGLWIWLAGMLVAGLSTWLRHRAFRRRLARSAKPLTLPWEGLAGECALLAGLRRVPPLFTLPGGGTPFLCGVRRPWIVIPEGTLARLSREEARHVLLHEMLHVRRHDLAANWLLAAARAVHWFNPLIHLTCRRFLADRELLRDHQAIALLRDPAGRAAYGHTLLKLALPPLAPVPSPGLAPFFRPEKKELKRRLVMIQTPNRHPRLSAALAAATLTGLTAVLFTTAQGQEQALPAAGASVETGLPATTTFPVAPVSQPTAREVSVITTAPALLPSLPVVGKLFVAQEAPPPPLAAPSAEAPSPLAAPAPDSPPAPPTPDFVPRARVVPALDSPPAPPAPPAPDAAPKALPSPDRLPGKMTRPAPPAPEVAPAQGARARESLRDVARRLRDTGREQEAAVIEEALQSFPAPGAPPAPAAPAPRGGDIQQLRAELAALRETIAEIRNSGGQFSLEDELARLKLQEKSAASAGLGPAHPKIASLRERIGSLKQTLAERAGDRVKEEASKVDNDVAKLKDLLAAENAKTREAVEKALRVREQMKAARADQEEETGKALQASREETARLLEALKQNAAHEQERMEKAAAEAVRKYMELQKKKEDSSATPPAKTPGAGSGSETKDDRVP